MTRKEQHIDIILQEFVKDHTLSRFPKLEELTRNQEIFACQYILPYDDGRNYKVTLFDFKTPMKLFDDATYLKHAKWLYQECVYDGLFDMIKSKEELN